MQKIPIEAVFHPEIQPLLADRGYSAEVIIVEPGDSVKELDAALGFPIMVNRASGIRYGDPGFLPSWEYLDEHQNWYELAIVTCDDGFGYLIFIPKKDTPQELLDLCNS